MKFLVIVLAIATTYVSAQDPVCSGGDFFVPHEDCTKYYICDNGVAVEQDCPGGLFFNPTTSVCDFQINVPECSGGTRPPIDMTTVETEETSTTEELWTTSEEPLTTEDSSWSSEHPSTIIESTMTTNLELTTPVPTTRISETPETEGTDSTALPPGVCPATGIIRIPHEERCDAYYLCFNGDRSEFECPTGMYFDALFQTCRSAELVSCVSITTISPHSSPLPQLV